MTTSHHTNPASERNRAFAGARRTLWCAVAVVVGGLSVATPAISEGIPIRGVVKAVNYAALSTDVALRIARLSVREGQAFKKGDIIVEFDCRRQAADLEAVQGAVREAEMTVASNESLHRFKALGRFELDIARARLDKARGEMKSLKARLDDCVVRAPFDGRVAELQARELEFTTAQKPYLIIIEDGNFEIEMIVSSTQLAQLVEGLNVEVRLDDAPTARVHATIVVVPAVIDPVSKTARVMAHVKQAPPFLSVGMSGTIFIGSNTSPKRP